MGTQSVRRDNVLVGQAGCALIFNLSSSRILHPLSELATSLSGWGSLSESASLSESISSFLHLLFFGLQTELNLTLGHKKWSFYFIKSHKKENIYNFHKKIHKFEAHCYFLANFQYNNNSWIAINSHIMILLSEGEKKTTNTTTA